MNQDLVRIIGNLNLNIATDLGQILNHLRNVVPEVIQVNIHLLNQLGDQSILLL